MSLAEQRWLRLFTLCVLYVAQGIPWGFMATTLPGYLTAHKVDAALVGTVLSFTTLPYSFKWVWGPIIDTVQLPRFGRRRPWIIFAQGMMALTMIILVTFDLGTEIKLLTWTVFIHTVFNSLQDVSVDALAVDLLDEDERGRANGLMYGSKYVGGAIGGVGMAKLMAYTSLDTGLVVQTAILGLIMLVPLLVKESNQPPPPRPPAREVASALAQAFSLRSTVVAAVLMLGMNFGIGVLSATGYQLFITKLHWTYDQLAVLTGGWGLAVGGTCAAITGFLVDKFGRRRVAAIASCALAAGWIGFAQLQSHWGNHTLVYAAGFWDAAWSAILSVSLIALCMDLSWPRIAGSQFTAYMALSNFSTTLGYQAAAKMNATWTFYGVYVIAGCLQLAITLALVPIDPHETRTKLPLPAGTRMNPLALGSLLLLVAFLVTMTVRAIANQVG